MQQQQQQNGVCVCVCVGGGDDLPNENEMGWTFKVEIMQRTKFVAVGEACMAIFWPTPGFKGRTFVSSVFKMGALICASTRSKYING